MTIVAAAAGFVGALGLHISGSKLPVSRTSPGQASSAAAPPTSTVGSGNTVHPRPSTTSGGSSAIRAATGATEQYGYGQLAVRVTVHGAKITGLGLVGLQTAETYSQQIANQVVPMLRAEVLAGQSVQVNGVSGATYTTEAYLYSIQSALNKLRFK